MNKPKIQRVPNWFIMFDSETEADELLKESVPFKKVGDKVKRLKGRNVRVGIYFGELRSKFFDKHAGKWGVKGESRFVEGDMIAEVKANLADAYRHYKKLETEYLVSTLKSEAKAS